VFEVRGLQEELASSRERQLFDAFSTGQSSYRARAWDSAIKHFERALQCDASDQPSILMRQRATHYRDVPPTPIWDGVWTLANKQSHSTPESGLATQELAQSHDAPDTAVRPVAR
jgi:hypothetical protein